MQFIHVAHCIPFNEEANVCAPKAHQSDTQQSPRMHLPELHCPRTIHTPIQFLFIFMRTCFIWLLVYFITFFIGLLFSSLGRSSTHYLQYIHLCTECGNRRIDKHFYIHTCTCLVVAINLAAHVLAAARIGTQRSPGSIHGKTKLHFRNARAPTHTHTWHGYDISHRITFSLCHCLFIYIKPCMCLRAPCTRRRCMFIYKFTFSLLHSA